MAMNLNDTLYSTSFRFEYPPKRRTMDVLQGQWKERERDDAIRELKSELKENADKWAKSGWDECHLKTWKKTPLVSHFKDLRVEEDHATKTSLLARREALKKLFNEDMQVYEKEFRNKGLTFFKERI